MPNFKQNKYLKFSPEIVFIIILFLLMYFKIILELLTKLEKNFLAVISVVSIVMTLILFVIMLSSIFSDGDGDAKKKIKNYRDLFLVFGSVIIVYLTASFLAIQIYEYLKDPFAVKSNVGMLDKMDNETLLTMLSLLISFGALLSYIFHKIILRDIKVGVEREQKIERMLSRAGNALASGLMYSCIYKTTCESKTQIDDDNNQQAIQLIKWSIIEAEDTVEILTNLKRNNELKTMKDERLYYIAKNNLAFYLERKWRYFRKVEENGEYMEYEAFMQKLEDNKQKDEYIGDRRIAKDATKIIMKGNIACMYPDKASGFEETKRKVKRTFSITEEELNK